MRAVIDTSPIVAILSPSDNYHNDCVEALKLLTPPLLTTWAVLTEAHYLLRDHRQAINALFRCFKSGLFLLEEIPSKALGSIHEFMDKYSDLNPQIADVSIMYLAEERGISNIFTLDKRDFSVYRFSDKTAPIIIPK
ncbi:hypothetical protein NIES4101_27700 (plasmid) [Calothrix sp. NIES-4101]|nr:hypothetical protein NIES4101_27700 [Calothrix sp. NIES-4101]